MFSLSSLSRQLGASSTGLLRASLQRSHVPAPSNSFKPSFLARFRNQLAPKKVKHLKRHKGRVPIPTGGSTKGTTLAYGEWGIRIKGASVYFPFARPTLSLEQATVHDSPRNNSLPPGKSSKRSSRFSRAPKSTYASSPISQFVSRVTRRVWVKVKERLNIGRVGASSFASAVWVGC
jgi:hypothetical protein